MNLGWIKIDRATIEKPEVLHIANALKLSRDEVLGKLLRLWLWFDAQSRNGRVTLVRYEDVDQLMGVQGFADACRRVQWLEVDRKRKTITMPNFERFHGEGHKIRALNAARQQRFRARQKDNVTRNATVTPKRYQEKRRISKVVDNSLVKKEGIKNPLKRMPSTQNATGESVEKNRRIAIALRDGDRAKAEHERKKS